MMMNLPPQFEQYDPLRVAQQQNVVQSGRIGNQTSLLQLEELRRAQEEAALARQFMAANAGQMVPGGGGSPLLASPALTAGGGPMTQQTVVPGQPPGAPQPVPGGQDLSQFAAGGAPQSTLGGLQPQQDPLQALMAQSPGAALQVMQTRMKMQEQQLSMREKVAGAVGQLFQGVTDQASYDEARAQVQQFNPRLAAQLPPVYNKDQVQRLVKQAVDVKTSATLAIENMKAQAEIGKYNLQFQNAGYAGLGDEMTAVLKGMPEEKVKEFGGRTTPPALNWATEQINARKLTQTKAAEVQRGETEAQLRGDKTVSEAFGERTTKIYDTQTGQTVDARMKVKDYEAMPQGRVKELSGNQTEQMENVNNSIPIVSQLQTHIDKIYGPGGVLARLTKDERRILEELPWQFAAQYGQKYPELIQAQRFINSNAGALARALAGEKGAMAEGDVERAKEMLPNLTSALQVWPPDKWAFKQPDTRGVALRSMNSVVDLINGRVRSLLGNEQFTHPKLHRYEVAEEVSGKGQSPDQPAAPEPAQQFGPAFGAPAQQRYVPGEGPAPAVPGRQSQAPAPARPTRVSQLAGAPKFMDQSDVVDAMRQTGKSRAEVERRARELGYTVYGSTLPLPEETMVG